MLLSRKVFKVISGSYYRKSKYFKDGGSVVPHQKLITTIYWLKLGQKYNYLFENYYLNIMY